MSDETQVIAGAAALLFLALAGAMAITGGLVQLVALRF